MFAAVYVFMYAPVIMQPLRKCTHMCVRAYDGGTSVVVTYVNFYFGGRRKKNMRGHGEKNRVSLSVNGTNHLRKTSCPCGAKIIQ